MSPLEFQLSIGFLIASFTILAIRGGVKDVFRRRQQVAQLADNHEAEERARRIVAARLDPGKVLVNTQGVPREIGRGLRGYLQLVGSGSYGQNMLVRELNLLYACGLEGLVGLILLVQHNAGERDEFEKRIPTRFRDRIIYGYSPSWSGGFANRPTSYALTYIDEWAPLLRRAAEEAAYFHEQRNGRVPGQIIFFWSEGGQAPVGLPVIEALHKRFPRTQIVGMTSLPSDSRNRRKFAELKDIYGDELHHVDGWVVNDELQEGFENADTCMAALVVSLSDAQLHDDTATQFNNVLAQVFTEQPGSVAVLQYVHDWVVAYEWRVEGELLGYWVDGERVVGTVQSALRVIEDGKAACSAQLPIGEPNTSIYDVVMPSVGYDERHDRDDLLNLSDRVNEGYHERLAHLSRNGGRDAHPGLLYGLAGYHLKFGSLAVVIDPQRPACRVIAVRLAAVEDGRSITDTIAAVPRERMLPHERKQLPASANGHSKQEDTRNDATSTTTPSDAAS